ncbi:MAG: hypothetical protein VXV96_08125 [Bdellovibrionota bacterium]|nr:hypothetical protein [Bdellovibrionota bacterium]
MNLFTKITLFINGALLVRFSLSKLFAWPISVQAFIEMAQPLSLDPTFFRISTGVIISITCLSYFISFFFGITKRELRSLKSMLYTLFSNALGIIVMSGALLAEFFLRVQPKWPLVVIAIFIATTSLINLILLKKIKQKEDYSS